MREDLPLNSISNLFWIMGSKNFFILNENFVNLGKEYPSQYLGAFVGLCQTSVVEPFCENS